MTAIDAAIVELEAHREHVCQAIRMLRRFAQVVEEAHEPTPNPVPDRAEDTPPSEATPASPLVAIAEALRISGQPLRSIDLCARTALPRETVREGLRELVTRSVVRASGKTSARVYTMARPRQGTAAGTQAALSVGPSPANGTPTRDAMTVVWNGTKERNGDAPSILPPRERRP
jgi:hypothetical protein